MATAKRKTNVQLVKTMMEFSSYGPLAQVFIMQAISEYAKSVASSTPEKLETPLVSGAAWHGVAVEIKNQIDDHYKN